MRLVRGDIAEDAGIPKPTMRRLRATWVVHHLTAGTPAAALVPAAGVDRLAALAPYLRWVATPDPHEAVRLLREAGA